MKSGSYLKNPLSPEPEGLFSKYASLKVPRISVAISVSVPSSLMQWSMSMAPISFETMMPRPSNLPSATRLAAVA